MRWLRKGINMCVSLFILSSNLQKQGRRDGHYRISNGVEPQATRWCQKSQKRKNWRTRPDLTCIHGRPTNHTDIIYPTVCKWMRSVRTMIHKNLIIKNRSSFFLKQTRPLIRIRWERRVEYNNTKTHTLGCVCATWIRDRNSDGCAQPLSFSSLSSSSTTHYSHFLLNETPDIYGRPRTTSQNFPWSWNVKKANRNKDDWQLLFLVVWWAFTQSFRLNIGTSFKKSPTANSNTTMDIQLYIVS